MDKKVTLNFFVLIISMAKLFTCLWTMPPTKAIFCSFLGWPMIPWYLVTKGQNTMGNESHIAQCFVLSKNMYIMYCRPKLKSYPFLPWSMACSLEETLQTKNLCCLSPGQPTLEANYMCRYIKMPWKYPSWEESKGRPPTLDLTLYSTIIQKIFGLRQV